jgi:hypothetical protein
MDDVVHGPDPFERSGRAVFLRRFLKVYFIGGYFSIVSQSVIPSQLIVSHGMPNYVDENLMLLRGMLFTILLRRFYNENTKAKNL